MAFRYAACGCGDQVCQGKEGVSIAPRGCGHKLCPRCSRKLAARVAKRVLGHLAGAPHGVLFSHCLTQRVRPGESLRDCRSRHRRKFRRYMRSLGASGLVAGMATTHIVWSQRGRGWHYHVHCLLEFAEGTLCTSDLLAVWRSTDLSEDLSDDESAARVVLAAGPALVDLHADDGDLEFWGEARSEAAKAVQYPLRDMLEGLSAFRLGSDPAVIRAALEELYVSTSGARLRECYGRWRKKPEPVAAVAAVEDRECVAAPASAPGLAAVVLLGTVSMLWRRARAGDGEAQVVFRGLERSIANHSDFARRFVAFCRLAWCPSGVKGASDG